MRVKEGAWEGNRDGGGGGSLGGTVRGREGAWEGRNEGGRARGREGTWREGGSLGG